MRLPWEKSDSPRALALHSGLVPEGPSEHLDDVGAPALCADLHRLHTLDRVLVAVQELVGLEVRLGIGGEEQPGALEDSSPESGDHGRVLDLLHRTNTSTLLSLDLHVGPVVEVVLGDLDPLVDVVWPVGPALLLSPNVA